MRRCPLLALIAVVLFASTPMPARRSDVPPCCRGGACPMRMQSAATDCAIGGCDDQAAAKIAFAHATRVAMIDASPVPLPRVSDAAHVAMRIAQLLAGVHRAPERPPRMNSPFC